MICAVWTQTIVLFITALIIGWYTFETSRLRREMVRQNEIALRPVVVPVFEEAPGKHVLKLHNVGAACAFNVKIQPLKQIFGEEGTSLAIPHETIFVPIEYLAAGNMAEVQFWKYSNGEPTNERFLQGKWFPRRVASPTTMTIWFDDVEGVGYAHKISVEPRSHIFKVHALQLDTDIVNVKLMGIHRRADDAATRAAPTTAVVCFLLPDVLGSRDEEAKWAGKTQAPRHPSSGFHRKGRGRILRHRVSTFRGLLQPRKDRRRSAAEHPGSDRDDHRREKKSRHLGQLPPAGIKSAHDHFISAA